MGSKGVTLQQPAAGSLLEWALESIIFFHYQQLSIHVIISKTADRAWIAPSYIAYESVPKAIMDIYFKIQKFKVDVHHIMDGPFFVHSKRNLHHQQRSLRDEPNQWSGRNDSCQEGSLIVTWNCDETKQSMAFLNVKNETTLAIQRIHSWHTKRDKITVENYMWVGRWAIQNRGLTRLGCGLIQGCLSVHKRRPWRPLCRHRRELFREFLVSQLAPTVASWSGHAKMIRRGPSARCHPSACNREPFGASACVCWGSGAPWASILGVRHRVCLSWWCEALPRSIQARVVARQALSDHERSLIPSTI